jgi:hypothetical protein
MAKTALYSLKLVLLVAGFIALGQKGFAQATPSNDCSTAAAQQQTVGSACSGGTAFNVNSAIGLPALPACAGFTATGQDGWAWFTATSTSTNIEYTNTNRDAVIYIYRDGGTACTGLVNIGCSDQVNGVGTEFLTVATTIGQRYYVRICRYNGTTAPTMTGNLCVYNCTSPSNELCSGATPITLGNCASSQRSGCAGEGAVGCGGATNNGNAGSTWYSFVAPANGTVNITVTLTAGYFSPIVVYAACGGAAISCYYPSPLSNPYTSQVSGLTPGNTYYVDIAAPLTIAQTTFSVCISAAAGKDCSNSLQVCSNATINGSGTGFSTQELNATNRGCQTTDEINSSWYVISIGTSGTLTMTITPSNGSDDYDFSFWGPNSTCPPTTAPIRCTYVQYPRVAGCGTNTNPTGLSLTAVTTSEGACNNTPYLQFLNVIAGETYVLLVNAYTPSPEAYTLSWGGTSTLSCIPVVLPIELLDFEATLDKNKVELKWATATETNNDYFTVEKSKDGYTYEQVAKVSGSGTSTSIVNYTETDFHPYEGISYYRLKQTDYNGLYNYSNVVPVEYHSNGDFGFSIFPNPGEAKDDIKIQLNAAKGQEILVVVRDLTGREFFSKVLVMETANGQIEAIDNNHTIAPGVYLVTASSMNAFYSQKLIIKP